MSDRFDYIIYHNRCFDGFTGFFIFLKTKKWIVKPTVYPDYPSATEIPPKIDGKNVISIDVAYSPSIIEKIAEKAKRFVFIDHHKTDIEEIKNLEKKYPNLKVVYDVRESGASLTWKTFFPNKPMPLFLKYIKDNDIGEWKYTETLDFMAGLEVNFSLEPDIKVLKQWDLLLKDKKVKKLIDNGKKYNEYKNFLIKKNKPLIKKFPSKKFVDTRNKFMNKQNRYTVGLINNGCPHPSLVGKYIMENYDIDFCMIWRYDIKTKKYFLSLRSSDKSGIDVGEIAKSFGGGGHKYASGCSLSGKYKIEDLFNRW